MIRVQELIHRIELGEWSKALKIVVVVLGIIALTWWYDRREFKNMCAPEAMEAAQLARNLAAGRGFTTLCIRPLSIHLVEKKIGVAAQLYRGPHPDLVNPPVYPLLLAGLMKVVPFNFQLDRKSIGPYEPEMNIALFNQALFLLMVWLMFLLARRLFDLPVALLTGALLVGSGVLWHFSVSGLSTMLLLLILTGMVWGLVLLEQAAGEGRRGWGWFIGWAIAVGLLLGLGGLTRYSFAWLIIPVLAFCAFYLGPRRAVVCGVIAAVFLALMLPWMARNYRLSGAWFGISGYALQQDTLPFPGAKLERSVNPDLKKVSLPDYIRKFLVNTSEIVQSDLPKLGGSWVSAFFLVGLMLAFRNPTLSRLRLWVVGSLALLTVVQALGRTHLSADTPTINSENLLVLLAPLVFMYGVGMFYVLLSQVRLPFPEARHAVAGLFGAVSCAGLIFALLPPRSVPIVYPPYVPPWIQESAQLMNKQELMMSDMPWAVAWYGERPCVWTTMDAGESFYEIHDKQKNIKALYLTPLTTDSRCLTQMLEGAGGGWGMFYLDVMFRSNVPPHFPLQDARAGYVPAHLLLCDRPRWKERGR